MSDTVKPDYDRGCIFYDGVFGIWPELSSCLSLYDKEEAIYDKRSGNNVDSPKDNDKKARVLSRIKDKIMTLNAGGAEMRCALELWESVEEMVDAMMKSAVDC